MFQTKIIFVLVLFALLGIKPNADAQQSADVLSINFQQAEKLFLDSNLQIISAYYNIQSQKALVEQTRKWDNPVLNTDQNLYNNGKFFQHGADGQGNPVGEYFVQVQQLIKTAGKRRHQIDLAKTNVSIAEWQFKTVMRNLKLTLYTDFYTIAQLEGYKKLYTDNLKRLTLLQQAMERQLSAGNIAKKEYLRVQALAVSLRQDMADNEKALADAQAEIRNLLHLSPDVYVQPICEETEKPVMPQQSIVAIYDSAFQHNTDYNIELNQVLSNKQNLALQRSLAVPDLTVGAEFDQNANYAPNYYGLAISLPLPVWDMNRGNIKAAKFQVKAEEATMKDVENKTKNEVKAAWLKLQQSVNLCADANDNFYKEYKELYDNIVDSYNKRLISLIEFLDYYNDYQEIKKNRLQQILNLRLAKANLNDVVGTTIVE